MVLESLDFRIIGATPLLMHNGQTADPLNEFAIRMKEITGKRMKTDADHRELARIEWMAGLYLAGGKPCIPGEIFESALVTAAKRKKRGQAAMSGIVCYDPAVLDFPDKEMTLEQLWETGKYRKTCGVRVQRNRVMRTRPIFTEWAADVRIGFSPSQCNAKDVREWMRILGDEVGICDWRPKFGLFEVK